MANGFLIKRLSVAISVAVIVVAISFLIWDYFQAPEKIKDRLVVSEADFDQLSGWNQDRLEAFLPALQLSCTKILKLPKTRSLGGNGLAGTAADWTDICTQALTLPKDSTAVREFMVRQFSPLEVRNNQQVEGTFTGYYEASLKGSKTPSDKYSTPLYKRPEELVMVSLGRFREELKGHRIAGKVVGGELVPFADRKAIDAGALDGRDLEIVWVDSAVDAFFLHIQGSGRIELEDGSAMRVGYAGQNGHPYLAIGRTLIENGEVAREDMSMQTIRDWLEANPDKAQGLMQENASYIFFRELETGGPIGAQGVELTAGRSLAVDRKWLPLGVPIWLQTDVADGPEMPAKPFNRLMMAQDTGGAIRGPVRGDVFWGYGKIAYARAGAMKNTGRYWILLPKEVAQRALIKSAKKPK